MNGVRSLQGFVLFFFSAGRVSPELGGQTIGRFLFNGLTQSNDPHRGRAEHVNALQLFFFFSWVKSVDRVFYLKKTTKKNSCVSSLSTQNEKGPGGNNAEKGGGAKTTELWLTV